MQRRTTQKYRRDDKKKTFFSLFFWPCVRVPFGAAKRLTASTRSRGARETLATFYYFPSLSLPPNHVFSSSSSSFSSLSQELELLKLVCLVRFQIFLPVLYEREVELLTQSARCSSVSSCEWVSDLLFLSSRQSSGAVAPGLKKEKIRTRFCRGQIHEIQTRQKHKQKEQREEMRKRQSTMNET